MPFVPSVLAPSSHYHSHKWWEASGQCLVLIHTNTNDTFQGHIHVGSGGVWTSATAVSQVPPIAVSLVPPIAVSLVPPIAVSLVPPTAGLHYTPMHTDFPPSGVLLSNYGLSAVSTPLATSQVGDTLAHIPAAVLSLTMCTASLITGLHPWGRVPCWPSGQTRAAGPATGGLPRGLWVHLKAEQRGSV